MADLLYDLNLIPSVAEMPENGVILVPDPDAAHSLKAILVSDFLTGVQGGLTDPGSILTNLGEVAALSAPATLHEILEFVFEGAAAGDIIYRTSTAGVWAKLPAASNEGKVLKIEAGIPKWINSIPFTITIAGADEDLTNVAPTNATFWLKSFHKPVSILGYSCCTYSGGAGSDQDLEIQLLHSGGPVTGSNFDAVAASSVVLPTPLSLSGCSLLELKIVSNTLATGTWFGLEIELHV